MLSIIAHSRAMFSLRRVLRQIFSHIASDCPLCAGVAAAGALCLDCAEDMTQSMRTERRRCHRCAQRVMNGAQGCVSCRDMHPRFTRVIAAFDYEPPFDSLIGRYKAEHRFGLSTTLARLLADAIDVAGSVERPMSPVSADRVGKRGRSGGDGAYLLKANTILVPIPASDASLRRRGFNPAAELAASLGGRLQLPVWRGALRRVREGPRQAWSNRVTRQRAAEGLFECTVSLNGLSVGLVDDVMTTGSTVNAATAALLRAGAVEVTILVAARTPVRYRTG